MNALDRRVKRFRKHVYILMNLLLLILIIFKLKCNKLILKKIIILNASYVGLHTFSLCPESPNPDPERRTPHFWGGSVTPASKKLIGQWNLCQQHFFLLHQSTEQGWLQHGAGPALYFRRPWANLAPRPLFLEVGLRHLLFIGKHHRVCKTGVEPPLAGCHHAPLPPGPMPVHIPGPLTLCIFFFFN
jgi:hypothetical protein